MTISITVMALRRRAEFVKSLVHDLGGAHVVWDQFNDRWDTGRRAWLSYDPSATHHMVIQDDAIVPPDLPEALSRVAENTPTDCLVSMYAGRTRAFRGAVALAQRKCHAIPSWLRAPQLMWGVAVMAPTTHIRDMIAYGDRRTDLSNYDTRLSEWCMSTDTPVYYPWPSLVNHRISPSLIPGRGYRGRVAHNFIGAHRSALSVNLTGPVVDLVGIKRLAVR